MILQLALQNQAGEHNGDGICNDEGAVAREDAIDKPEGNSTGKKGIHAEGDALGVSAAEGSHGLGNKAQRR